MVFCYGSPSELSAYICVYIFTCFSVGIYVHQYLDLYIAFYIYSIYFIYKFLVYINSIYKNSLHVINSNSIYKNCSYYTLYITSLYKFATFKLYINHIYKLYTRLRTDMVIYIAGESGDTCSVHG